MLVCETSREGSIPHFTPIPNYKFYMTSIPKGISTHGIKLLLEHNYKVSLYDLKKYDNHAEVKEITELKKKANNLPVDPYKEKILNISDFINWTTGQQKTPVVHGKKITSIQKYPVKVDEIWRELQSEIVNHQDDYTTKTVFFSVPWNIVRDEDLLVLSQSEILGYFKYQSEFIPPIIKCDPPSLHNNLVFGWVTYAISNDDKTTIQITEIQSTLESDPHSLWPRQRIFTSIVLTEFLRIFCNNGYQIFEINSCKTRQNILHVSNFPMDVYSKMLTNLGFEYVLNRTKLRYEIKHAE